MIYTPVRLRGLRGSLSDREVLFNTAFLGDWQTASESPTFIFLGDRGVAWTSTPFSEELLGREPNLEDFLLGNWRVGWFCERVLGIFSLKPGSRPENKSTVINNSVNRKSMISKLQFILCQLSLFALSSIKTVLWGENRETVRNLASKCYFVL